MAKKTEKTKTEPAAKAAPNVGPEYTRLIVLWIVALLLTAAQFFVAYRWLRPNILMGDGRPQVLLIALAVVGIAEFVLSIWLWREIQIDAGKKRDLKLSQMGYFVAWLLCLAIGPLGFAVALSEDGRYYYGFFILAALGVLYHQPARETLAAAAPEVKAKPETATTTAATVPPPVALDEPPPAPADDPAGADAHFSDLGDENDVATNRTNGNN